MMFVELEAGGAERSGLGKMRSCFAQSGENGRGRECEWKPEVTFNLVNLFLMGKMEGGRVGLLQFSLLHHLLKTETEVRLDRESRFI